MASASGDSNGPFVVRATVEEDWAPKPVVLVRFFLVKGAMAGPLSVLRLVRDSLFRCVSKSNSFRADVDAEADAVGGLAFALLDVLSAGSATLPDLGWEGDGGEVDKATRYDTGTVQAWVVG